VASKYLNDEGELEALTNTDFATIGSIPRPRLDHLEMKFLDAIVSYYYPVHVRVD